MTQNPKQIVTQNPKQIVTQFVKDPTYQKHEEEMLKFWDENEITYVNKNDDKKFEFIDGPPFCSSSNLHFGHILVGIIKSSVLNYKHMHGFTCANKLGYDVHGLPMETVMNAKLGVYTKQQVENYGIGNYNKECKKMVLECAQTWTPIYKRIARWADFENVYRTMDTKFMESSWWIFKQLWSKQLVYRSHKVLPYCIKCTTSLSNFEISSSYKNVRDMSVYVKFKLCDEETFLIAWTTTPWTLPSHYALCVNPNGLYVKFVKKGNQYITSKSFYEGITETTFISEFYGNTIVNKKYIPPFNFLKRNYSILNDEFVDISNETGIVHLAPSFGEDDYKVCIKNNIVTSNDIIETVDDNGNFTDIVHTYYGKNIFETNKKIIADLEMLGVVYDTKLYEHSYPHCPRSNNPLIYKTITCYFINVEKIKHNLIKNNNKVTWMPKNIGTNRFGNWLEEAKDWNISRQRYFGTPIPVWMSDDGSEMECIGSIEELMEKSGCEKLTDIHRENVDDIIIIKNGKKLKRIIDIFDCWYESGSMIYAQHHYPFENENMFDDREFLSDFVAEGLDQCRGWFYTLMVLSTALFDKPAFKNVVCTGLILAKDGKKISKSLGNYENPIDIINEYGADAVRLYLLNSCAVKAEPFMMSNNDIGKMKSKLIQYFNGVVYFVEYYIGFTEKQEFSEDFNLFNSNNIMDKWIMSRLGTLIINIEHNMDLFQIDKVISMILIFIEELTNWYIKFNRERISDYNSDALKTLFCVIYNFNIIIAPFVPFISEYVYQKIKKNDNIKSVHHCTYPSSDMFEINLEIEKDVEVLQKIVETVRYLRSLNNVTSTKPLNKITISCSDEIMKRIKIMDEYICNEINCLQIYYKNEKNDVNYVVEPNMKILGKMYRNKLKKIIEKLSMIDQNTLQDFYENKVLSLNINIDDEILTFDKNNIDVIIKNNEDKLTTICGDIIVTIDPSYNEEVNELYEMRLFVKEIQQIRKNNNLHPNDEICVYYDTNDDYKFTIKKHELLLKSKIKYDVLYMNHDINDNCEISEIIEINKKKIILKIKLIVNDKKLDNHRIT